MFNTVDQNMRSSGLPRILEGEDRNKFIAAVRSPIARDLLNFDVSHNTFFDNLGVSG
jgi:hypothetical protein